MDVRLPIGLMFAGAGVLLITAGLLTDPALLKIGLVGFNLDLVWGGAMTVFGVGAIAASVSGRRRG
jgi:hypothetical protein